MQISKYCEKPFICGETNFLDFVPQWVNQTTIS